MEEMNRMSLQSDTGVYYNQRTGNAGETAKRERWCRKQSRSDCLGRVDNSAVGRVSIGDSFMRSRLVVFLALGFVASSDAALRAQPGGPRRGDPQAGRYGWLPSLEEGKAEAGQGGEPRMGGLTCWAWRARNGFVCPGYISNGSNM